MALPRTQLYASLFFSMMVPAIFGCASGAKSVSDTSQWEAKVSLPSDANGALDVSGGAWRMIETPALSNLPNIVRTPIGWLAASRRGLGEGKIVAGFESALYRSDNGIDWELLPVFAGRHDIAVRGLAYGGGRYVMLANLNGGRSALLRSEDGRGWVEIHPEVDPVRSLHALAFAGDRFFACGFQTCLISTNGETWREVAMTNAQPSAVVYGNGRYLLVGSGPMEVSSDGLTFTPHDVDCALPGACIMDPSGGVHQGFHSNALFAEGRFFADQLSSPDGVNWLADPERAPVAYVDGRFMGDDGYNLKTWRGEGTVQDVPAIRTAQAAVTEAGRAITDVGVLDNNAPIPARVEVPFDDGLTCETASCVVVNDRLYLVPPPGTAALPDRVPRNADGKPLLTDECPVSGMIFCQNYADRTGCVCHHEAPRGPSSCQDVSQYRCEGRFSARPDEWQIAEVADAGCSCNGLDPSQPESFGLDCKPGEARPCVAPLRCLAIDPPPSSGIPFPQRYVCSAACQVDADCPSWEATGFCAGHVSLRCSNGSCQPRACQ